MAGPSANATKATTRQLAFALSNAPDTRVHLHLTVQSMSLLLFLSTSSAGASAGRANLGSFVYALPNQLNAKSPPPSTSIYVSTESIDFATRLAKILAKRTGKPAYVGGELKFWTHEDEGAAMKGVVDIVMKAIEMT